jgi:hypothetical protein
MSVAIQIIDGPSAGHYRSIICLFRALSPTIPAQTFYRRLYHLSGLPEPAGSIGSLSLTAANLAWLCRPRYSPSERLPHHEAAARAPTARRRLPIQVLSGPLAGLYSHPGRLHEALGDQTSVEASLFAARIRELRRTSRTPAPAPLLLTAADLVALGKPSRRGYLSIAGEPLTMESARPLLPRGLRKALVQTVRSGLRSFPTVAAMVQACAERASAPFPPIAVLDGPYRGSYETLQALVIRLVAQRPTLSVSSVRRRLGDHRKVQPLAPGLPLELSGTELDAIIVATEAPRYTYQSLSVRVTNGVHAGEYPSLKILYDQTHEPTSCAYVTFTLRLKNWRLTSGGLHQQSLQLTSEQLSQFLEPPSQHSTRIRQLARDLLDQNPSGSAPRLEREIERLHDRRLPLEHARVLLKNGARHEAAPSEHPSPIGLNSGSPYAIAIHVLDGPYAGHYAGVRALSSAVHDRLEVSYRAFYWRIAGYGVKRYGTHGGYVEISDADLGPLLVGTGDDRQPRRALRLRVTCGPHAGEYRSIRALYNALGPAVPVRIASFTNHVRAWLATTTTTPGTVAELTDAVLTRLVEPRFSTAERLRAACASALAGNPDASLNTLQREIAATLGQAPSLHRIKIALNELTPNGPSPSGTSGRPRRRLARSFTAAAPGPFHAAPVTA